MLPKCHQMNQFPMKQCLNEVQLPVCSRVIQLQHFLQQRVNYKSLEPVNLMKPFLFIFKTICCLKTLFSVPVHGTSNKYICGA
jgi:hypothetical protein